MRRRRPQPCGSKCPVPIRRCGPSARPRRKAPHSSAVPPARSGPVLGATPDADWGIEHVWLRPGQQLVVVTDGITEAASASERFGEERLHARLERAVGPAQAIQGLEEALSAFTDGSYDDDAAIVAITPTSAPRADEGKDTDCEKRALVERLFDAFNRRDEAAIVDVCDERMEFFPVTAAQTGRIAPYTGPEGLREYLGDVASAWEELLIDPSRMERRGDRVLVRGRVYLRSRQLGIRDMPAAWVWEIREGHFVRGEVFADPEQAALRFDHPSDAAIPSPG